MSKLEELIQELCPDGVEYKSITDVFDIRGGYTPSKSNLEYWTNGTIPWFRMEDIRENGHVLSKALQYVSQSAVKKNGLFPANSIALATSATIGEHALITVECLGNQRFTFFSCKEKYNKIINMNFMNHYFCVIDEWCKEHLNQGSFASVDMTALKKLEIPVPPLEVQQEIVRLLDEFTAKTEELQAELNKEYEARKTQYEYYKRRLFDGTQNHTITTLQDICENCDSMRKPVTSGNRESGNIPYYGASGIVDYVKDYILDGDYLLVSEDGANLVARSTPIAFSISGKTWVNNHAHVLKFNEYATRKYVEMYLNSIDLKNYITGAAQPKLNQKNLNKITIPLPSLVEQKQIVSILESFEVSYKKIISELTFELESRQKQYEYYRDKLLTFKELK